MKKYAVMVPFAGHYYTEVEANTKEEAKALAMGKTIDDEDVHIEELEYFEQINQGNVFYGTLSEIDIEEIE